MPTKIIHTRIAGFNHHEGAAQRLMAMSASSKKEVRLLLVPEPQNPYDGNAIAVSTTDGLMLGYIPRVDNEGVLKHLRDRDVLVRCFKTPNTFNSIDIVYITGDPLL